MPGTLRRPGNRIHTTLMSLQLRHRHRRRPDIQNHNLVAIHQNRRHVPQVLLVPRQSQQRRIGLRTLVDDRRVLLISQIENPHRTVGRNRSENPSLPPRNVVNLLIMRNQLSLNDAALNVPDRTGRVDATSPDSLRLDLVPVERSERSAELGGLAVVQHAEGLDRVVAEVPEADEVAGGGEEVRVRVRVRGRRRRRCGRVEHELRRRVRVVKGERRVERLERESLRVEAEDVDPVVVGLDEAADGDAVVVGPSWRRRDR